MRSAAEPTLGTQWRRGPTRVKFLGPRRAARSAASSDACEGLVRASKPRSGTRPDLGFRARSGWEANFARYLNLRKERGEIVAWEYEPTIFEFPVKRGNRTYRPDFKVFFPDGHHEWFEVKGWMDSDSRIKLKRFGIHYPDEPLNLVDKIAYKALEAEYKEQIPLWE